jgi:hypothetical protein
MAWLTGICRNAGEVSALPAGGLPAAGRGHIDGIVVWERVASDLGALEGPGHDRGARRAGRRHRGRRICSPLREIVAAVRNADNIGEIGIGLNPAARIAEEITEAKKAFGTVHVALGDSANEYGGLVECEVPPRRPDHDADDEFDGDPGRRRGPPRVRGPA